MNQAESIVFVFKLWSGIGGLVAAWFLTFGIDRLDADARGAYAFRPLLVPAVLLIWPLVLWRSYTLAAGKDIWAKRYLPARRNHKWIALVLPVMIIAIIAAGLLARQAWPVDEYPQQIASWQQATP